MLKRAAATQACMDRFAGQPLVPGKRDCGTLAEHLLHRMGRKSPLLRGARHTTMAGAVKYIRGLGFASLPELIDAELGITPDERIAPAGAWPADLIGLASEDGDGFGCSLSVVLDGGRVLTANPATGLFEPMTPHLFVAAWRV
ncbi:DUF6950 family protein [Brevundimonas sp.]